MIKNLEGMVAEARTERGQAGRRRRSRLRRPPAKLADPSTVKSATAPPQQAPTIAAQPRIETAAVPVPVTFIFNEANADR